MQGLWLLPVLGAALSYRLIVLRQWRAGRLSDRSAAVLGLARFPALALLFGLITGLALPLVAVITVSSALLMAPFYPFMLDLLQDQRTGSPR